MLRVERGMRAVSRRWIGLLPARGPPALHRALSGARRLCSRSAMPQLTWSAAMPTLGLQI